MANKEYKIAFELAAQIDSTYTSSMKKVLDNLTDLEAQARSIDALRISGDVVKPLRDAFKELEKEMKDIRATPMPAGIFAHMKTELKEVLLDAKELEKVLQRIHAIRMPSNQFGGDVENYVKQIRDLEKHMSEIQNMHGPQLPPGGGVGGGGGMMAGVMGAAAFAAPALAIGAAVGIAGAATLSFTDEYQRAMVQIETSTGASKEQMDDFSNIAENLYNQSLGENWADLAESVSTARQVTQQHGKDLEDTTRNAIAYRDVFGEDIKESIKASDTMMRNFGVTSKDAYNLLAQGAQNGLNKSGELLDSANEYAPHFKSLGFTADQMFDTFSAGLGAGAFNLDKVGDAIKEFNIRSKDMSTGSVEAFQSLGMNAEAMSQIFAKGGPEAQESFRKVSQAISAIEDPVKRNTIGVQLFGTQFEDLEAGVIAAMSTATSQFNMTKETMNSIVDIKYDTLGKAFQGIGRQLQTALILPISKALIPIMERISNWMRDALPAAKALFGGMRDSVMEAAGKLSFLGDAWDVAKSLFTGGDFNMGAWDSIVEKLQGLGIGLEQSVSLAQTFTAGMIRVKNTFDLVKNSATLLFSIFGGGADLTAWQGIQDAVKGLGGNTEQAYQFATNLTKNFIKVKDAVQSTFGSIKAGIMGLVQNGTSQFAAWIPKIVGFIQQMAPTIMSFVSSIGSIIAQVLPVIFKVAAVIQGIAFKIISVLAPIVAYVATKIAPVFASAFSFISTTIIPILTNAMSSILPKITAIMDKLGDLFTAVWEVRIKPMIDLLVAGFEIAFPYIQKVVTNVINAIAGVIDGAMVIIGGVIDFITGVFTGNWELAWQGVKDIFVGIFKTLGAALTLPLNMAIDGLNMAIRNINKVDITIPDWVPLVGGNRFGGFGIPEIPKVGGYADGGIVSSPELAWVGEGGDREVIVPINNSERSRGLWETAGNMLGANRSQAAAGNEQPITITYAPKNTYVIQGGGSDVQQQVRALEEQAQADFEKRMARFIAQGRRLSYGNN